MTLPAWTTSCPDWEERIVARRSIMPCAPLFPSLAAEAWDHCAQFRLVDVMGQPTMGEATMPWLREWIEVIFGAEDPESGRRHINEFFFCSAKKNTKSTGAAAIMLTAALMNWRQSAELIILSPTKEIADNSYKPIRDFIKADDGLSARFKLQDYFRLVTDNESGSTIKVVAADSDTVSGKKASFVFVDELHEFGKQAKASNMLLEATGGLTSRPEGFVIYATTQSEDPPAGVFKEKLAYARGVRDGRITDRKFLPLIYEFPRRMVEAGEHENLQNAYISNPNWGASVDIERITQLHSQARESGGKGWQEFLAKHLNVEIGLNLRSDRWAGADFWERRGNKALTLDALIERSEVLTVGIDGGGLDDLLALAVIGRETGTGKWLHWAHAWAHPLVLERRKEVAPRLLDFQRDGDLTIVAGLPDDVSELADIVARLNETGLLGMIGCDPAGIGTIVQAIVDRGIPQEQIIGISQGWRMNGAIKTAERKLAEGGIEHCASALMAWAVGNAKVEPKGNAVSITKQAAGSAKIDPLMATFNAVELMARNPSGSRSFWELAAA